MPSALVRACASFGCPHPQPCPQHGRKAQQTAYDDRRGTAHQRGYTTRQWVPFRQWYLDEQVRLNVPRAGLCGSRLPGAPITTDSQCEADGLVVIGVVLDHIQPVRGKDDPRFYDVTNLQLLCDGRSGGVGCHDRKRQRERKGVS